MIVTGLSPWAGDNPYIYINVNNFVINMQSPNRTFWVYFNVQTVPSRKYEDLREVATAASWSFMIDTGTEQLLCTNTVSYDVLKVLNHAELSYKHKDKTIMDWTMPVSTEDAMQLSSELRRTFAAYSNPYMVSYKQDAIFEKFGSVLKCKGELSKYRFSIGKKKI